MGDLMAPRISQSLVPTHLDEFDFVEIDNSRDVDADDDVDDAAPAALMVTSMAYLPQNSVLCELRHEAFEACVSSGPLDVGLVSKWRPKDRVSCSSFF